MYQLEVAHALRKSMRVNTFFFFCMKFYEASTDVVPKLGWGKVCWCGCSLVEEGAVGTQDSAASRLGCLQAES